MRDLYLSDLHLGSPLFKGRTAITSLIASPDYDRVFLVGDIIDVWEADLNRITNFYAELVSVIRYISRKKPVYYILGNHDPSAKRVKEVFPNCIVSKTLHIGSTVFLHGHDFDLFLMKYYKLIRFLFYFQWVLERTGINVRALIRHIYYNNLDKLPDQERGDFMLANEKKIFDNYCLGYDVIICGHTHLPKIIEDKDTFYVNCGDWIHSNTYVVKEGEKFYLKYKNDAINP